MDVIPVIEIKGGKSARLTHVKSDQPNILRDDVLLIAHRWKNEGATRLHIHDVDGARVGMPQNRDQVRDIVRRVGLPVQYSGGVRSVDVIERVMSWGVDRVIADAEATLDLTVKSAMPRFAGKVALELRPFNGRIPHPGAPPGAWLDVYDYLRQMNQVQGWPRYIYRAIYGDGSLAVPVQEDIAKFVEQARKPVSIYTRLLTTEDFRMILQSGAESLLIGEALYDGKQDLPGLLLAARRAAASPAGQTAQPGRHSPLTPQPQPRPQMPGTSSQFGYRTPPSIDGVRPPNAPSRFPIPPPLPPLPPRKDKK